MGATEVTEVTERGIERGDSAIAATERNHLESSSLSCMFFLPTLGDSFDERC